MRFEANRAFAGDGHPSPAERQRQFRWIRWGVRLAKWFHPSEVQRTLLWAALIGCLGGISAFLFRTAILGLLWLFTGHSGGLVAAALALPWWKRLVIPALGGSLAGLALDVGARFARGRPSADYMEAVALGDGVIHARPSLAKSLSSLLTIASGGSIGREGAMVQLSATLASRLGRWFHLSTPRLRLLVACGAAAGVAAVYDVTITAALFVAEIVLGSIAMESLGPLLLAAVASSLTSRYLGVAQTYISSPRFELVSGWEVIPYCVAGMALGSTAPGFITLLRKSEDLFHRFIKWSYLRLTVGGLIVGALSIAVPEVWGNGRSMVNQLLQTAWPWSILTVLLVCKVAATAATVGSGAVGGVFTPTLFTGAMIGGLLGHAAAAVWPGQTASPQAYALVGMGGFLAATTRAPLMSMMMIFEMTLNYGVILPLMLVCVTAYYVASSIQTDSIYSESLRRKADLAPPEPVFVSVADLMKPPPATVVENAPFVEVAQFFTSQPYNHLFVVSPDGQLRGGIALQDVKNYLQNQELSNLLTASELMQTNIPTVTPETGLREALEAFRHHDGERLPVIRDAHNGSVVGSLSKTDLLLSLADGAKGQSR